MQKVHSYFLFKFFTRAAYKTTISVFSLTVLLHYRLYILFSLRGRFPFIQTDFFHFTFKFLVFINTYTKGKFIQDLLSVS